MLKKARKLIIPAALYTAALLSPTGILALVPSGELVPKDIRPINNIVSVIRTIIQFVLAVVMLLIGGIRWITAGGDEKAVGSARNMITAALIGLVIVLVAYALIKLVETFFGINIISGGVNIPQIT